MATALVTGLVGLARALSRGSDFELAYASPKVKRHCGADEESVLRHERKKQKRYEEGKLEADGRNRRHRGSSDDEGHISSDGFSNEDLRVGGPYLTSIPVQTETMSRNHRLYSRLCSPGSPIRDGIWSILVHHGIRPTSIDFVGRQSRFNPEEKPVTTAVILATRKEVDNTWLKASREIWAYLADQGLKEVCVEIADPEVFKPQKIFPVLRTDASLAIHGNETASSTLGGFIELKIRETGLWSTFGITCFHCLIPEAKGDNTWLNKFRRQHGIKLFDETAQKQLRLDHPSLYDMEQQLERLGEEIDSISKLPNYQNWLELDRVGLFNRLSEKDQVNFSGLKEQLEEWHSFAEEIQEFRHGNRYLLGHVAAASGFKMKPVQTIQNAELFTNLDWALIQIHDGRVGHNSLPDAKGILDKYKPGENRDLTDNLLQIHGRSSGHSKGRYSALKVSSIFEHIVDGQTFQVKTLEHSITSMGRNPFSEPGDSGSLVHAADNRVAGMLVAGAEMWRIGYFTHMDDLFEDILELPMRWASGWRRPSIIYSLEIPMEPLSRLIQLRSLVCYLDP